MERKDMYFVIVICLLALGARLFGIDFGLPHLYLVDEEFFVQPALRVAEGNINPGWFGAPAQPLIYGMAILFRGASFFLNVSNGTSNPVTINYDQFITIFQTLGRLIPVLAGTVMTALTYVIGRKWNRRVALLSGFAVATSFYFIDHSHIIRPDIVQTCFLLAVVLFLLNVYKQPEKRKWYIWAGIFLGLAITTKYPSLFFLVPVGFVFFVLFQEKRAIFRNWLYGIGAAILSAFVSGPILFLRPQTAWSYLLKETSSQHGGHDGLGFLGNFWWYISHVLGFELGTFFYVAAGLGSLWIIIRFVRERSPRKATGEMLLVVAAVSYLILISILSLHWERWIIPTTALLFIIAAIGVDRLFTRAKNRFWVVAVLLVILFAAPLLRSARVVNSYALLHTEDTMRDWITQNIPEGTRIVVEPHTVELSETKYTIEKVANMTVHSLDWYREHKYEYFIISGGVHGRIVSEAIRYGPDSSYAEAVAKYTELFSVSNLLHGVLPYEKYPQKELLYCSDFCVVQSLELNLQKGEYQKIYGFE